MDDLAIAEFPPDPLLNQKVVQAPSEVGRSSGTVETDASVLSGFTNNTWQIKSRIGDGLIPAS